MTRDRILDAAINCFIELGYTMSPPPRSPAPPACRAAPCCTTSRPRPNSSRPRSSTCTTSCWRTTPSACASIPAALKGKKRRRAGLDAYWDHLTGDLFVVYHELCVASRTDPELRVILENSQQLFEEHVRESNAELFAEWNDRGDRFLLAMDVTKFLMEGMAAGQLMTNRDERVVRLMNYLRTTGRNFRRGRRLCHRSAFQNNRRWQFTCRRSRGFSDRHTR